MTRIPGQVEHSGDLHDVDVLTQSAVGAVCRCPGPLVDDLDGVPDSVGDG
jgi:hypothetical protein